jgi:hypothetical protein
VASLSGIGVVNLWRDYNRAGWRSWALPVALVASALAEAHILSYFPDWSRWLTPLVVGTSILVAAALVAIRLRWRVERPIALALAGAGVVALLLTPSIWSEYTVAHASGNLVPSAGPRASGGFGFAGGGLGFPTGRGLPSGRGGSSGFPAGGPGFAPPSAGVPEGLRIPGGGRFGGAGAAPPGGGFAIGDTAADPNLVRYLESHQGHTKFLVGTLNATTADPYILATGRPVMDLGGFGGDHILTVKQLAADVKNGTVRYFLLSSMGGRGGPGDLPKQLQRYLGRGSSRGFTGGFGGPGGGNNDLAQWVTRNCRTVSARAYQGRSGSSSARAGTKLYDCGAASSRTSTRATATGHPSTPPSGGEGPSVGGMHQLTACLSKHGVTVPSPGQNGQPPTSGGQISAQERAKAQAGFKACGMQQPGSGPGQGSAPPGTAQP